MNGNGGALKIGRFVQDVFCPPSCVICRKVMFVGEHICRECKEKLPVTGENVCLKCGKPLEGEFDELCRDCRRKRHYFDRNVALWTYSPQLKQSVYRFKYNNKRRYGIFFAGEIMHRYAHLIKSWNVDAIIPVPLFKGKLQKRGFNQAAVIADELGRLAGIEVCDDLVVRVRNTKPMKELDDKKRLQNIKGSFNISKNVIQLKKILLVDDIFTTGSTVDEISRVLKYNGVEYVYVITLCVGRGY